MSQQIRSPINISFRQEEIQPWTADQTHMAHLILESSEQLQSKHISNANIANNPEHDGGDLLKMTNYSPKSYNFESNLRKYEMKKAGNISLKKEKNVNFIQKNKKELFQQFDPFNIPRGDTMMSKILHQRHKQKKCIQNQLQAQESVNWSMIMYYETDKSQRRTRHKDIQSFMRFQSQKIDKMSQKNKKKQEKIMKQVEPNLVETDNYQRILKLREGLRRRNLKSASQSRKLSDNTLNIEEQFQPLRISKPETYKKQIKRSIPKTSDSNRSKMPIKQLDFFGDEALVLRRSNKTQQKQRSPKIQRRMMNTSQRNRPIANAFNLQDNKISNNQ